MLPDPDVDGSGSGIVALKKEANASDADQKIGEYLNNVETALDAACGKLEHFKRSGNGMWIHSVSNLLQVLKNQKYFLKKISRLSSRRNPRSDTVHERMLSATIELGECLSVLRKILADGKITRSEYRRFQKESAEAVQSLGFLINEVETFYARQQSTRRK